MKRIIGIILAIIIGLCILSLPVFAEYHESGIEGLWRALKEKGE